MRGDAGQGGLRPLVALPAAMAAGLTAACDLEQAVDCAELAVTVTGHVDDLGQAASTGDGEVFRAAADGIDADLERARGDIDDEEVRAALDSLAAAVENLRVDAQEGVSLDLAPVREAGSHLAGACGS